MKVMVGKPRSRVLHMKISDGREAWIVNGQSRSGQMTFPCTRGDAVPTAAKGSKNE